MSTREIIEHLKRLNNSERLAVIEAATRLIREDLGVENGVGIDEDPILKVAGCLSGVPLSADEIEQELYMTEDEHFIHVGMGFQLVPSKNKGR